MINDNLIDAVIKFKNENYLHSMKAIEQQEERKIRLNERYEELKFVLSQLYDDDTLLVKEEGFRRVWWDSHKQDLCIIHSLNKEYPFFVENLENTRKTKIRIINKLNRVINRYENPIMVTVILSSFVLFAVGMFIIIEKLNPSGFLLWGLILFNAWSSSLISGYKFPHRIINMNELINDSETLDCTDTIMSNITEGLPREIRYKFSKLTP